MRSPNRDRALSPPIDRRNLSTLISELKQLIPFYTPEWHVPQDSDSGSALLEIFARMVAGTIEQLNQVPEKNYIAFLNLLGVKIQPAQPAKAPVSFYPSQGTAEPLLIPARTKLSAEKDVQQRERVVFETEKNFWATPAQLVAAYSIDPHRDGIFPVPSDFLRKKLTSKAIDLEQFTGENKQEHSLYLGHSTLGTIPEAEASQFVLEFRPEPSLRQLADEGLVVWEYWAKHLDDRTAKWCPFDNIESTSGELILQKDSAYQFQEKEIDRIKTFWIRCTFVEQQSKLDSPLIQDLYQLQIEGIKIRIPSSTETESSDIDYCFTLNNLQFINKTENNRTNIPFRPFQVLEDKHQAIYLGFDAPLLKNWVSLFFALVKQAYPKHYRPRLRWEYYRQRKEIKEWTRLNVRDETHSLTQSGIVEFMGSPDFAELSRFGQSLYWIRVVDVEDQFNPQPDRLIPIPKSNGIYLNTTWAVQTETIEGEIAGSSNGKTDQAFTLFRSPLLSEEVWIDELSALTREDRQQLLALAQQNSLQVEEIRDNLGNVTQFWVKWRSRTDLLESTPSDRHYEIDRTLGQFQFGDGRKGAIPPIGIDNIRVTYRVGGGKRGNVDRGQINRLNSPIAYIDRVTNPEPAEGGADPELLEQVLERGPQPLKHRNRAVTAEDFERLTQQASRSVARVKCLPNINREGRAELGWVSLIVVPQSGEAQPQPSVQLKQQVEQYLRQRATNLIIASDHFYVGNPVYVEIAIQAKIVAIAPEAVLELEWLARQKLDAFLHPLTGGYKNRGWPFGRSPCRSDFYALLGSIPNVERVDSLFIVSSNNTEIQIPPNALVSSGKHQIEAIANV